MISCHLATVPGHQLHQFSVSCWSWGWSGILLSGFAVQNCRNEINVSQSWNSRHCYYKWTFRQNVHTCTCVSWNPRKKLRQIEVIFVKHRNRHVLSLYLKSPHIKRHSNRNPLSIVFNIHSICLLLFGFDPSTYQKLTSPFSVRRLVIV